MPEKSDESVSTLNKRLINPWVAGPKDFIFNYIRYLPLVAICVLIALVIAYIKVRYTISIYHVESSLLIKNDRDNSGSKDQRFEELFMSGGSTNLSNEMEMLRSRPVLQRVARDLDFQTFYYNTGKVKSSLLYPDHPYRLDILKIADSIQGFRYKITAIDNENFLLNESKTPVKFGQLIENGGNRFILMHVPGINIHSYGSSVFEIGWQPLSVAAEYLLGSVKVGQVHEQSTILTLSFEGENPKLGKDVLNTLMAVYDTLIVEDKNRISSNTLQFINNSLYELSDTLKGVQGVLRNFMVTNQAFDIEGQSKSYIDKMAEAYKQRAEQDVNLGILNFLMKYMSDTKNVHELVPTILNITEPALLQLVTEYNHLQLERESNLKTTSPNNPLVINLDNSLDKLRREIVEALLNVRQAYNIANNNLDKQDEVLRSHITALPGKSMQLLNIERQQKILEELYSLLLQKKLETNISTASTISNSKVVEPAIIFDSPISPDTKKIYSLYFLFGLIIPVGFIALREVLRDKVTNRGDLEKHTSVPILGEIGHSKNDQSLVVIANSRRLIAEQFRIIRTNLQYLVGKKEKPVIMVTSSFSGEGKSFISTNMGAVLALSGKKTVIMEFDIRKPKIVSGLDLKRKMGITNYIIGKASFEDLLVKVGGIDNLYVIPCGPIPPNPSELLLDERLGELMKEVLQNFDVVIMDTAPVGLVSDAVTLGKYADSTLYIVRQGYTFRKQLGLIEELYINKKLPGLCLLLNDIKTEGGYYGPYYGGYGYSSGYGYGGESAYFEHEPSRNKMRTLRKKLAHWWSKWFA